jgi:hypothetical protein
LILAMIRSGFRRGFCDPRKFRKFFLLNRIYACGVIIV